MAGSIEYQRPPDYDFDGWVGLRIRMQRDSLRWSQAQLASRLNDRFALGWHQTTVAKVESGERPLRFVEAVAVSQILSINLRELAYGTRDLHNEQSVEGAIEEELTALQAFLDERARRLNAARERYMQATAQEAKNAHLSGMPDPDIG